MSPDGPVLRGTAETLMCISKVAKRSINFIWLFQNWFSVDGSVAELTGRHYRLYSTWRSRAEQVMIIMGSGAETVHETVDHLQANGEKVGLLRVRCIGRWMPRRY